jgi:hypothetical protein
LLDRSCQHCFKPHTSQRGKRLVRTTRVTEMSQPGEYGVLNSTDGLTTNKHATGLSTAQRAADIVKRILVRPFGHVAISNR